jgi:adenylosuccinate synthase
VEENNRFLEALDGQTLDGEAVVAEYLALGEEMAPYITDTVELLHEGLAAGKSLLLEGAQGTLLDVDFGTYPYVTSSSACVGGISTGSGIPPTRLDAVMMILKSYCTRVGSGPFPSELEGEQADRIRERGREYGTTTGRPRRVGWFDAVAARHTARLNDPAGIALTLMDVLDEMDEVGVVTAYRIGGQTVTRFPADSWTLKDAEPVVETVPGWKEPTSGVTEWDDLPGAAREYVAFLEETVGAQVALVSTGPDRAQVVRRPGARLWTLLEG